MSTRCNIVIKDDKRTICLYHHHDGYPEGVGSELTAYLDLNSSSTAADMAIDLMQKYDGYELTGDLHGDINYLYFIYIMSEATTVLYCYHVPGKILDDPRFSTHTLRDAINGCDEVFKKEFNNY